MQTTTEDPIRARVAGNVRAFRQSRRLTLEELSERLESAAGLGISASALLRVEQGKRGVEAGDLVALALALEVTVADLLAPAADEEGDLVAVAPGGSVERAEYLEVIGVGGGDGLEPGTEAVVVPAEQMQAIASAFAAVGAAAGEAARQFGTITANAASLRTIASSGHPRAAAGSSDRLLRQAGFTTEQLRDRFGPDSTMGGKEDH